jgi:serine/threonine protein kinase
MDVAARQALVSGRDLQVRVEPGRMLGNYEIIGCLARGGMGSVWVARHHGARGFTKLVAMKTILPELAVDPVFERMLSEEARLAALIRHPNVCEIFELIEREGLLALSMEWVDGESLSRLLATTGRPLEARIAARIVAQAAAGLHAAHELCDEDGRSLGLVHRDVSPQNILISRDGHVRLSDFGIAKAMNSLREATATGQVRGKLAYMSPEQARNEELDRRSDVFSLGVVLYVAVLGKRPFSRPEERSEEVLARLLRGEYAPPCEVDPSCPPEIAAIVTRAMHTDKALRYQSADELRCDLEKWLFASGALTTEHDVARVLNDRCGAALDQRTSVIRGSLDGRRSETDCARQGWSSAIPAEHATTRGLTPGSGSPATRRVRRALPLFAIGCSFVALVIAAAVRIAGVPKTRLAPEAAAGLSTRPSSPSSSFEAIRRPEVRTQEMEAIAAGSARAKATSPPASAPSARDPQKKGTLAPAPPARAPVEPLRPRKYIGPVERDL